MINWNKFKCSNSSVIKITWCLPFLLNKFSQVSYFVVNNSVEGCLSLSVQFNKSWPEEGLGKRRLHPKLRHGDTVANATSIPVCWARRDVHPGGWSRGWPDQLLG